MLDSESCRQLKELHRLHANHEPLRKRVKEVRDVMLEKEPRLCRYPYYVATPVYGKGVEWGQGIAELVREGKSKQEAKRYNDTLLGQLPCIRKRSYEAAREAYARISQLVPGSVPGLWSQLC